MTCNRELSFMGKIPILHGQKWEKWQITRRLISIYVDIREFSARWSDLWRPVAELTLAIPTKRWCLICWHSWDCISGKYSMKKWISAFSLQKLGQNPHMQKGPMKQTDYLILLAFGPIAKAMFAVCQIGLDQQKLPMFYKGFIKV